MKKIKIILFILLTVVGIKSYSQIYLGIDGIIHDEDSCTFDTSCNFLIMDTSVQNIWQIGSPDKTFFDSSFSIPNAIVTDTINYYPINNFSYFDLKFSTQNMYWINWLITFKHKFDTDTLKDGGFITISYNYGQTWTNVLDDTCLYCYNYPSINSENLYTHNDTLINGNYGFSGNSGNWITTRFQWINDLPCKHEYTDTIILRFNFISDSIQTNKEGWLIDNIILSWVNLGGSINEVKNKIITTIYPNPFKTKTNIRFYGDKNEIKKLDLKMYNIYGQIVNPKIIKTGNKIILERNNLENGLYVIKFSIDGKILTSKKLLIFD